MVKKIFPKIYKISILFLEKFVFKKFAKSMDKHYFDQFLNVSKGKLSKSSLTMSIIPPSECSHRLLEVKDRIGAWSTKGDHTIPGSLSGYDRLKNPGLNKSLAFSIEERQMLGIHGLLPPVVKTQKQQIDHCKLLLERIKDPLDKYIYLMELLDFNEKLLYALVRENVSEMLPLLYTPTVGTACLKWGLIYRRPRGIYITFYDKGHIYETLKNWPETDVRIIVVTDGERILGLGDQGACGMGIPVGKLALYTALAGIKPHHCLPITIDVGTNNEDHLKDDAYPGLKEKRRFGKKYDELIDEFMQAVVQRWGRNCLIQFEDFGNKNAFKFLGKYRNSFCTFNDDIQGTASVAVAGLFAALRITKTKLSDNTIVFQGAGEANIGIANLCVMAMISDGQMSEIEARNKIWMVDSKGLITKSRPDLEIQKKPFAQDQVAIKDLLEIVRTIKPTILIGAAAVPGTFTSEILKQMAINCKRPIVFALSNPTVKAECTAQEAYNETKGAVIFASGSPFPPVMYNDKKYITGQGNNAYIFPAVGLAAMCAGIPNFSDDYFLIAAEALASQVKERDLEQGCIYPPLDSLLECSVKIATRLVEYAYRKEEATVIPEPENKEVFVRSQMYDTTYEPAIPSFYHVPTFDKQTKKK